MERNDVLLTNQQENLENQMNEALNCPPKQTAARTSRGFKLVLAGALILLAGCFSTMVIPYSSSLYSVMLFGPTSIGACMVMFGLYCVLE